jgi:hypothetical protein
VIAVIGCGAAKLGHPAPAADLYTGSYFRACSLAAATIAPGRWFILSAKHGLITPATVIEPYDLTLGQPGAVDVGRLRFQAGRIGLLFEPVTALCGARYADLLAAAFTDVRRPLAGLGIGRQLQALKRMAGERRADT